MAHVAIRTDGWTRENVNVREETTGKQFRFVLPGPPLAAAEWERCIETLSELEPFPRLLVVSGSLPPGVPADFYARLARRARSAGSRMILDTSGEPLRLAARQGVYLLKPSLREFQELTGSSLAARAALVDRARELIREGRCEILVLSLGAEGALWVSASQAEWMRAPAVDRRQQRRRRRQPGGRNRARPLAGRAGAGGRPPGPGGGDGLRDGARERGSAGPKTSSESPLRSAARSSARKLMRTRHAC